MSPSAVESCPRRLTFWDRGIREGSSRLPLGEERANILLLACCYQDGSNPGPAERAGADPTQNVPLGSRVVSQKVNFLGQGNKGGLISSAVRRRTGEYPPARLLLPGRLEPRSRRAGRRGTYPKSPRRRQSRVPDGYLFGTGEKGGLISSTVRRRTGEYPPARLLLPGGLCLCSAVLLSRTIRPMGTCC